MDVLNWCDVNDKLCCAGQPQPQDWSAIAASGVQTVVNLRPAAEQPLSEQPDVEAAGMRYVNIPIGSLNDFTEQAISQFRELLNSDDKLLVHCASGNRVGALYAFTAAAEGKSVEQALELGRSAGLTKLAPMVEARLRS